ncbi:MAG: GNAT family N-acetyltransferase [Armatimonadetes bacterium]|nr:GNAT family N-acetyltransferase [Armatimonadota bacterium]
MVGPTLVGKKAKLRPLRDDDLERRVKWLNDPETHKLLMGCEPSRQLYLADAQRWRSILESDPSALVFAIDTIHGRHIGDVDLHNIDKSKKSAKLTILIGDKSYWDRGYGSDVIKTLLDYAFSDLGLESVALRVFAFNKRAMRCYEKCGFRQVESKPIDSNTEEISMVATKESFALAMLQNQQLRAA